MPEKYIMDHVHGLMPFDRRLFQIIDTPEVQRLRNIKQLGVSYFVFPGATHNRLSHCLGVGHLAGKVYDRIVTSDMDMRPTDRLMFQAAGILHDIGHGPFSHVFEAEVMPTVLGYEAGAACPWNHEMQGLRLIDKLIDENHVDIFDTHQIKQLKAMITGEATGGRKFLGQVISNSDFGIDVDRLDYLQRDASVVGIDCDFNPGLMLTYMRLIDDDICFSAKKVFDVFQFFQTRYSMFTRLYQNTVSSGIELLLRDILLDANAELGLERMVDDLDMYVNLNDSILDVIQLAPGMEKAKQLLRRLKRRQLYKHVSSSTQPVDVLPDKHAQKKVTINYGMGAHNPLENIKFYMGNTLVKYNTFPSFLSLPATFSNTVYRVYDTS